jgi:hypothetical protein
VNRAFEVFTGFSQGFSQGFRGFPRVLRVLSRAGTEAPQPLPEPSGKAPQAAHLHDPLPDTDPRAAGWARPALRSTGACTCALAQPWRPVNMRLCGHAVAGSPAPPAAPGGCAPASAAWARPWPTPPGSPRPSAQQQRQTPLTLAATHIMSWADVPGALSNGPDDAPTTSSSSALAARKMTSIHSLSAKVGGTSSKPRCPQREDSPHHHAPGASGMCTKAC